MGAAVSIDSNNLKIDHDLSKKNRLKSDKSMTKTDHFSSSASSGPLAAGALIVAKAVPNILLHMSLLLFESPPSVEPDNYGVKKLEEESIQRSPVIIDRYENDVDVKRKFLIQNVQQFMFQVHATFHSVKCMNLLLSSSTFRNSLKRYLDSCGCISDLNLHMDFICLLNCCILNLCDPSSIISTFSKLCELYVTPINPICRISTLSHKLCERCMSVITIEIGQLMDEEIVDKISLLCADVIEESIHILYQRHFIDFLASKEYVLWFVNETERALSIIASDVKTFEKFMTSTETSNHGYISALANFRQFKKKGNLLSDINAVNTYCLKDDFTLSVISRLAKDDFAKIYRGQYWLSVLLSISEGLPVGFCVSSVAISQSSNASRSCVFPLVFANTFFETVTGHNIIDIRGQCVFDTLFRDCKNTAVVTKLYFSFQAGHEMSCKVDCVKKDGTPYKNLVSIRPIFDSNKQLSYIVMICVDLSSRSYNLANEILTAEVIMSQLPNDLL